MSPPAKVPESVAIIGLGLIGGSLALALRAQVRGVHLTAIDSAQVVESAIAQGIVDTGWGLNATADIAKAISDSELAVLATPVDVIETLLPSVLEHAQCVTDCGSTKRSVVSVARSQPKNSHYVPGHPMSGSARGGLASARADLFHGRPWLLCTADSSPNAVEVVEAMVRVVGADVHHITAAEHDRAVAITSHVPHIVASALSLRARDANATIAAGSGFEHLMKIAGGEGRVWRAIFDSNADAVSEELRRLSAHLEAIATDLAQAPPDTLGVTELLTKAGERVK